MARAYSSETAVTAENGEIWSFARLSARAEAMPVSADSIRVTRERGLALILETLTAWRDGAVLVPLDGAESSAPDLSGLSLGEEIVHVKTTSGSTGAPRCVLFTAEQLAADPRQIVPTMGLRREWPAVAAISMAHSYGFSNLILPLLLHGIPLILLEDPLPGTLRAALERHAAVSLPAVPAMWRAWHGAGVINGAVKLAISAGAPLPLELERAIHEDTGVKVHNFYGSSECGGIAYDRTETPRRDASLAGTAMEGVRLGIGPEGCLEVTSAAAGTGYWPPSPSLAGGVFRTADLAELDDSGAVRLLGRTGETINVAGRKIAPAAVEETLLRVPGVRHAVVFGVPSRNPARVEEIVACLNVEPGVTAAAVRRAAAVTLPRGGQPRHWSTFPDLVPDARGKISRAAWRARWLTEHAGA